MENDNIIKILQKELPWDTFLSNMELEGFIKTRSPNFSQLSNIIEYKKLFLSGKAIVVNDKIQSLGLHDPSHLYLTPYILFRPKTEKQLKIIIIHAHKLKIPITFASGKTGLSGGYSNYGITVDLADLHTFKEPFKINFKKEEIITEQSALISDLIKYVQYFSDGKYIFPIQPASALKLPVRLGGIISSNASGITSGKLGSAKDWIINMRIMIPNGDILEIDRNNQLFNKVVGGNGFYGVVLSACFRLYQPNTDLERAILYGDNLNFAFNGLQKVQDLKIFPLVSEFITSPITLPGKFSKLALEDKNLKVNWAVIIKGTDLEVNKFIKIMENETACYSKKIMEEEFQLYMQERSSFALLIQTSEDDKNYIAFPGFEDILSQPKYLPDIIDTINEIFTNHNFHKVIFGYGHVNFRRGKGLLLHMRLPVPIDYFYKENYEKVNEICETVYEVINILQNRFNIKHKAEHSSGPFSIWLDPKFRGLLKEDIKRGTAFENPHLTIYDELEQITNSIKNSININHSLAEDKKKELFIKAMSLYIKGL
ncbi:MAG: FAD-binding oxidoreductase [Promethearchaeota archaeon]